VGNTKIYKILAEGPTVAREIFLNLNTPRPPTQVYKKFQPNRSNRLAGYTQHKYIYIQMSCFILQMTPGCTVNF